MADQGHFTEVDSCADEISWGQAGYQGTFQGELYPFISQDLICQPATLCAYPQHTLLPAQAVLLCESWHFYYSCVLCHLYPADDVRAGTEAFQYGGCYLVQRALRRDRVCPLALYDDLPV